MKWLRDYELFKESKKENVFDKNIILEICTAMVLINNEFLDNILDRGLKARYSDNSDVFVTDLKNLLLSKNRLKLGKFENGRCVEDSELSKVNIVFDKIQFNIEKDWDKLVGSRLTARSIIDKTLPYGKINSDDIKNVFFIGPNKDSEHKEDIVVELSDNRQFSFLLNKSLTTQKTSSFSLFADDLIGNDIDRLFKDDYLKKWNKLTQEWIRIVYENANKVIQKHIECFIDPKNIEAIGYFEYFDIKHKDPKYKYLGEYIKEFDKNILKFSDLMSEIWKDIDNCFIDGTRVNKEWVETKVIILNSKILENLITSSLKSNHSTDIEKVNDGWKKAGGPVKMKLFKTIVEKIGCIERPIYFVGSSGKTFNMVPSREFFRKFYNDLSIKFDYHVSFDDSVEEDSDFKIKIKLDMDDSTLIDMFIVVKFSSEMSGKLSARYKFDIPDNFNYLVAKKQTSN